MSTPREYFNHSILWIIALVSITTLVVDKITPLLNIQSTFIRCLIDNGGHSLIAMEIWLAAMILTIFPEDRISGCKLAIPEKPLRDPRLCELMYAGLLGSLLDADHFVAALSLSLNAATSLGTRPLGHALLFVPLAVAICFLALSVLIPPPERRCRHRACLMVGSCLLSHQLRDSTRRGLWLYPLRASIPVSYTGYLACLALIVCVVYYLTSNVAVFSHRFIKTVQIHEDSSARDDCDERFSDNQLV